MIECRGESFELVHASVLRIALFVFLIYWAQKKGA